MPKITPAQFELLCKISDTETSKATLTKLKEIFGSEESRDLISEKSLTHSYNRQDIDVLVDDEERSYAVQPYNRGVAYFSQTMSKMIPVDSDDLKVYQVNFDWLLRTIMDILEMPSHTQPQMIIENKVWFIGFTWLNKKRVPIIFARTIINQDVTEKLYTYLQDNHKSNSALILTSSANIPSYFQLPHHNQIISIYDIIESGSKKLSFKLWYLAEKMRFYAEQEGFSPSYRTLNLDGDTFTFTSMQATALQFMDEADKFVHQRDIMDAAGSSQSRLIDLFKNHPARKLIFEGDGNGHYKLNL